MGLLLQRIGNFKKAFDTYLSFVLHYIIYYYIIYNIILYIIYLHYKHMYYMLYITLLLYFEYLLCVRYSPTVSVY